MLTAILALQPGLRFRRKDQMATALSWCIDNSSALIRDQTPQARKSLELAWLRSTHTHTQHAGGSGSDARSHGDAAA